MKLKETFSLIRLGDKLAKGLFILTLLCSFLTATQPFINIVFGALILDGLVSSLSFRSLMLWYVVPMVGFNLVLTVLRDFLKSKIDSRTDRLDTAVKDEIAKKCMVMDYEQLERTEYHQKLQVALDGSNGSGGFPILYFYISTVLTGSIAFIYSVVLIVRMFFITSSGEGSGFFYSPWSYVLLIAANAIGVALMILIGKLSAKDQYLFYQMNVQNNREGGALMPLYFDHRFIKDIKLFALKELLHKKLSVYNQKCENTYGKMLKKGGMYAGLSDAALQIGVIVSYIFIGVKAILGLISVGSIISMVGAITQFNASFVSTMNSVTYIRLQTSYLKNFTDFLAIPSEKYNGTLPVEKRTDHKYELEFKDVSFRYPNTENMILNHVSFRFTIGEKLAVVGKNGAGKTTFIKLLCRLYDPTEGEILLNGINIKKYDYAEYLSIFSVVFQDFKLFAMSVAENVAAGKDYDEEKVRSSLDKAGILPYVEKMPDGVRTAIYKQNDDGIEISGGEAQKIALARAIYKDSPIVILDEPTSALDPISEYEVYSKFNELVGDKTSVFISHRMSSCRFCDKILVFDAGRIVQSGSHERLLEETDGLYYKLWTAQEQYYKS